MSDPLSDTEQTAGAEVPPGIDAAAVARFFAEHVPGGEAPLRFTLIAGGKSNLTYRVDDSDGGTAGKGKGQCSREIPMETLSGRMIHISLPD